MKFSTNWHYSPDSMTQLDTISYLKLIPALKNCLATTRHVAIQTHRRLGFNIIFTSYHFFFFSHGQISLNSPSCIGINFQSTYCTYQRNSWVHLQCLKHWYTLSEFDCTPNMNVCNSHFPNSDLHIITYITKQF